MPDFTEPLKALDEARQALKPEGSVEWGWFTERFDKFRRGLEPMPSEEKLYQLYGESLRIQEFLAALVLIWSKRAGPGPDTTGARNLLFEFVEFEWKLFTASVDAGDRRAQAEFRRVINRFINMPEEPDEQM
jgi:hypothetical protein